MFVGIANTPRDYAWGSRGAISKLLGTGPSTAIEAELWLGAHPASPSRLVGDTRTLDDILDERLPFLLKVLAARAPLSLQAHPNARQAAEGFARENAAGLPFDAPNRNYHDGFPKPELVYALEDGFEALCGFRPVEEVRGLIAELIDIDAAHAATGAGVLREWRDRVGHNGTVRAAFEWLITKGAGVDHLVARLSELARSGAPELDTARILAAHYPGDPGIAISLMLNRVTLQRGQALYLPAGNIHAYLSGIAIELMTASDNVLRGGLTVKHVDVPELLAVLDFSSRPVPYLEPERAAPGVEIYRPDGPDFELVRIEDAGSTQLIGPAIALCTAGRLVIAGASASTTVSRGESVFITADEESIVVSGAGEIFIATTSTQAASGTRHT